MAKKRSGSEPIAGRFGRQESRRAFGTRKVRRYFLLVCEGEKTEPLYFEGLKKDLLPGVLQTIRIEIEGKGDNTTSLVAKAKKVKERREESSGLPIDVLWVVFDRDAFPSARFNEAIEICKREGIYCAWSNEAFELWYLLHFQYFDSAIGRAQYLNMLTERLQNHLGPNFRYQKNDPNFYRLLQAHGNERQAIQNAQRLFNLYENRRDFADQNPCTTVHLLVQELRSLT
ncbi:MAG: RloB domain-containing protein [Phycisphaerae bacterium]|nr:RloB domain-containing protein [Saprospiraceae bacterium]